MTKQGFEFFEEAFDFPYPFEKYDQLYVPEYNAGAMENAGAVTLRDEYLPRSRQDSAFYEFRCSVILHEMAHMWFGDLVTMRWWDDLWLNESFAEWACYHAAVENTSYTESWTGFTNARKNWALRQDQLPSTHPIAADNYDLRAVEVNFDGITYAKGASVLKQLVAWVGIDGFLAGLRQYFKDHAYGNAEFVDLLTALEKSSGRELDAWAKEWLQTSGVNTLSPEFALTADGAYASFGVKPDRGRRQPDPAPPPHRHRPLRRARRSPGPSAQRRDRHRGRAHHHRRARRRAAARPPAAQRRRPDLRQDPARRALARHGGPRPADARRLAGSRPVLGRRVGHDPRRGDEGVATTSPWSCRTSAARPTRSGSARSRATPPSPSTSTPTLTAGTSSGRPGRPVCATCCTQPSPGSNAQLIFLRLYAGALVTDEGTAEIAGLLDGRVTIEGLDIDTDLRWVLLVGLAKAGAVGDDEIDAELERDRTISGQENAAAARASRPDADAKAAAWTELVANPDVPNETHRSIAQTFMRFGQEELLAPYLEKYLAAADTAWEEMGTHMASNLLEDAFPLPLGSPELVERVDRWLEESPATAAAKRFVREGRADVVRALAAQARDAQA